MPPKLTLPDDSLRAPRPEFIGRTAQPADSIKETEFQPQPEPPQQMAAAPTPPANRAAMEPVAQRSLELSNHAYGLAQRGMYFAARAELIQSLQLVAQGLDAQHGKTTHAAALSAGMTALKEAQDFAPPAGRLAAVVNVAEITRAHQTPVLKDTGNLSPVVAQQQYLAYAQTQLAIASGHEAAASLTLFRLGKVQAAIAQHDDDPQSLHGPQAMVYYQAALAANDRNYLAANELAVLMAHCGQLQEARRLLVHSVSIHPHAEAWQNLAVVHRRLGETDLAQRAEHERQLLAQRSPATSSDGRNVQWVDAQTFAAAAGGEFPWPAAAQTAGRPSIRGSASAGAQSW